MSTVTSLVLSGKRKIIKQRPTDNKESSSAQKQTEAELRSASANEPPTTNAAPQQQGK